MKKLFNYLKHLVNPINPVKKIKIQNKANLSKYLTYEKMQNKPILNKRTQFQNDTKKSKPISVNNLDEMTYDQPFKKRTQIGVLNCADKPLANFYQAISQHKSRQCLPKTMYLFPQFVDNSLMLGKFNIPDKVVQYIFSRSSGPGGQNVNKVNTQVTAVLDIRSCGLFSPEQQDMIFKKLTNRIDKQGQLQLTSSQHRTQHANRQDVLDKMSRVIVFALTKPKPRKPTKPTVTAKRKRLDNKKRRSLTKKNRSGKISLE